MKSYKSKKCKICTNEFTPSRGLQRVCGVPCAIENANQIREKKTRRENNKRKTEFNNNDRGWLESKAKAICNKYIRTRDRGKPCMSCGKPDDSTHQRHASHYRPSHVNSALRYNPINIWASCQQCNTSKSGNLTAYRQALVLKLGEDRVKWLDENHDVRRYTKEELVRIAAIYNKKYKRLIANQIT